MSHNDVYKWFELYFPLYAGEKVSAWFQNGKTAFVSGKPMGRNSFYLSVPKGLAV